MKRFTLAFSSLLLIVLIGFVTSFPSSLREDHNDSLVKRVRSKSKPSKLAKTKSSCGSQGCKNQRKASSPSDVFCSQFVKGCYDAAMHDRKSGHIQVKHSCKRLGGKFSSHYSFSCVVDGKDETQTVLDKTGGGYTITNTVQGSTTVITGTVTALTTSTSLTTTTESSTDTESFFTTQTNTETTSLDTTQTSSITLTDAVPTTLVIPTSITTVLTLPSTVTTTTTLTQFGFSPTNVPVANVVITPNSPSRKKRFTNNDNSSFCQEFTNACTDVCSQRAKSTVKGTICRSKQDSHYSVGCYCKNGKVETQHALEAAVEKQHVIIVSTPVTSTTIATVTSTIVVPSTITSTTVNTVSTTITGQATITSSVTQTHTETDTTHTSTPTTVETSTSTSTLTTTTYAPSATEVVPTTTQILLAPTGYLGIYNLGTSQKLGVVADTANGYEYSNAAVSNKAPITFIAVKDANSPLYKLMHTDGTTAFTAAGGGSYFGGYDYEPGNTAYTNLGPQSATGCGSASLTAGPPDGQGFVYGPCEQFIFPMLTDSLTASLSTFNASFLWYNPTGSTTASTAKLNTFFSFAPGSYLQNLEQADQFGPAQTVDLRFPELSTT